MIEIMWESSPTLSFFDYYFTSERVQRNGVLACMDDVGLLTIDGVWEGIK